ncbi:MULTISPECIES: DUF3568 domain-containing protein [unclassified Francisella]|uniref:DUF3568 domain-containing protein n=1 Tax=unclassified Francisella TaxID=2610885 RepID=UPI002E305150|nr:MULTISPECIES: DUF3568 domain-containing protein [unclassified Francisella]MED7820373.1 DUF3568 domain-containing protein [Francisella sp. 19S2-4]MED7831208.1 DUF3568 domain-containing protein [Francisella sp. 19S2-10]
MKILNKKLFFILLALSSTVTLNSCILAAVAVGGGTVAYIDGNYSMNIQGNYKDVYNAALKAVNSNNDYVLVSKDIDSVNNNADIEGATKIDSTSFSIAIEELTSKASKVTIKFGTFGDQQMSSTLMDQIQANVHQNS